MRYHLAALLLLAVLPLMNVRAAPAPAPSAILDIGTPPKGKTAEQYRQQQVEAQTFFVILSMAWNQPDVRKLPSIASLKDARPWLAKNLRITEEEGGRRLRLTFRAGTREEQVTILNAVLCANLQTNESAIQYREECIRSFEAGILELEKRIESRQHPDMVETYRKGIDDLRSIQIPEFRAEIARLKQLAVVKWAK
jgi:hypothetical protein